MASPSPAAPGVHATSTEGWDRIVLRLVLGLVLALGLGAVASERAFAASPITDFYAGPVADGSTCNATGDGVVPTTKAATYSDFCVAYSTLSDPPAPTTADDLKSMQIDTPLGFAAAAASIPACPLTGAAGFNAGDATNPGCGTASQVGGATAAIRTQATSPSGILVALNIPRIQGRVFNLQHSDDEVALLGIVLDPRVVVEQPKVKVLVRVTLRPAPEVGLRAIIDNIPERAMVQPPAGGPLQDQEIAVDTFGLTFWGKKTAHPTLAADFSFLGSDCSADQTTTAKAVSWDGDPSNADAVPYRLTGCDDAAIPFAPSVEVRTSENRPDMTTETQVIARFGQSETPGVVASTVRKAVVSLPDGLSLSGQIASGAEGLRLCSASQFAQYEAEAAACPSNTAVGSVSIISPALDVPLTGQAFLGPQSAPGELPVLLVQAQLGTGPDAPRVKLVGTLTVQDDGRVVASLDDLPQLPVSEFALTFRGGNQSVLVTPPTCGTTTSQIVATPEARRDAPVTAERPYTVDADCATAGGFAPIVGFALDNPDSAGGSSPLTVGIARPDRSARIASTVINLPPGMLATLKSVPECSTADASAGTCPASTRVGSVNAFAGVGPAPLIAPGEAFLTERKGDAVAGIVFRVPVVFGDVDLGVLNVPADVRIRPSDQGLSVSAQVPERFKGIPLNLQALHIRLDRPGFALSPTSCAGLATTSSVTSVGGAVGLPVADLDVRGCERLPFAPKVTAAVSGETTAGGRPLTQVRVETPAGSSALRQAFVKLPEGLSFDLKQVARACSAADFAASACPAVASIGKVAGTLSITDEPLQGQLYLLQKPAGQPLPGIGLAFQGRYAANIAGQTRIDQKTGQLVSVFERIPDLPLTSFQIDVAGGTGGALVTTDALCSQPVAVDAQFVSSSGKTAPQASKSYCGIALGSPLPTVTGRLGGMRKGKPTIALNVTAPVAGAGQKTKAIRQLDVSVPSTWSIDSARARRTSGVALKSLTSKGSTSTRKVTRTKIRLKMPSGGTAKAKVLTRTNTLAIRSSSARRTKKKVPITVTIVYTDGSKTTVPTLLTPR